MEKELAILKRRIEREINSRKQAEAILEQKALELFQANRELRSLNESLENRIAERAKELEASELRYRQIIETASDIIYRADVAGYFTYVNPQAEAVMGYSQEEIIGKHFMDFIPEDWKERVNAYYRYARETQELNTYLEFPIITKSGEKRWLGQNVQLIVVKGTIAEAAAVARDITERKITENALFTTQLRMTNLIGNLQSGILVENENRQVVLTNERFCKTFQLDLKPDALIGINSAKAIQKKKHLFLDGEKFESSLHDLLAKREISVGELLEMKDGRLIERDYIPIFANGNYLGHLWQYRDVTETRKAEEMLRKSEEKYRGILENMELGLMEVDINGKIVRVYDKFLQMTGYEEEELLGRDANRVFVPDEFLPVMRQQTKDREKGIAGNYEIQLFRKDGSRIWMLIAGTPIYDEMGNMTGSVGIHYDLSKQKEMQQQLFEARLKAEEAQEAEKQFLANMSHEIRTPLNAIIGMSHLMYDTGLTEEQKGYLDILRNSSEILRSLINDLLDIAKIRAGKMEISKKEFDLIGLVRTLIKTFQLKLDHKDDVEVESEIDPRLKNLVLGDDLLLNQILLNLLGNAEKFTHEGKIGVRAFQKKKEGNIVSVVFEVFDTGIGIPKEKLELIFQSFRQVDGDIKREYGGTGLGLSIVKQLVEMQGGGLEVESAEGHGTVFRFTLDYEDTGKPPETADNKIQALHAEISGNHQILMVEDNSMNRRYLGSLLKKWNLDYDEAINGQVGVEMAQAKKYDLIFMDIQMPVLDGYGATIAIRSSANLNQETPIVALTASAILSRKDKAFEAGMNGYVSKPFTPAQLLEALNEFLPQSDVIVDINEEEKEENGSDETDTAGFVFSEKLDGERLFDLYGDDMEYAFDMFDAFIEKVEKEYIDLRPLFEQEEWGPLSKLTHKLKPAFAMVGLSDLEVLFQKLEDESGSDEVVPADVKATFEKAETEVDSIIPLIIAEKERLEQYIQAMA